MKRNLSLTLLICVVSSSLWAADIPPVDLHWLEGAPPMNAGTSFGVPWPKGAVKKDQAFTLSTADAKSLPIQTWPLAYWPDGSIKWSGFATSVPAEVAGQLKLAAGNSAAPASAIQVRQSAQGIDISTGNLQCRIPTQGSNLFESLTIGDHLVATNARLECILQKGPELDSASPQPRERFLSNITKVTVEQSGPVRAVVKIEGMHKSVSGPRQWLPFIVRLYFYAGAEPIHMVHSIVFDGNEKEDFIRGLGLVVSVPMKEEIQNRHVRFGGEGPGVWAEPIQPLTGWNRGVGGRGTYPTQIAGQRVPNRADLDNNSKEALDAFPVWSDFRLIQPNAEGFTIEKRTSPQAAFIPAGTSSGHRANGLVFVGDVSGGLGVGLKDFWQSYPTSLEVRNAKTDTAEIRVWLWSPDAPAMDVRHYDTVARPLAFTYEDAEPDLSTSTPYGVARTHELTLFPSNNLPTKQQTSADALAAAKPPLLICSPKYLHDQQAFGIWSLQDRSTPLKQKVEDYLDSIISFYQKAIDQQNWYGFWDYGDVMHSYDADRHEWKYDVGGFAWDNSEQGTDMTLWYLFLRSGRPDIFRMAEAMTRHTGEVDCYHIGKLAGLGSRHNIRHWGCGAKEARISMAPYRRFYYYLTTDERTGDVMHEMLQADNGVLIQDPMRKASPITEEDKKYPTRVRAGPDWFALVGNWMTEWERTQDTKWRDKIYTGMDCIAAFPFKINTSQNLMWYFYPDTGKLIPRDMGRGGYNLTNQMGGPEIIFELNEMVADHPTWKDTWRTYCENSGGGRFAAYMYRLTKDPQWAQRVINSVGGGSVNNRFTQLTKIDGPEAVKPLDEGPNGLVTNGINQTTLELLEIMDMVNDQLPANPPAQGAGGGRGGGRGFGRGNRGGATTNPVPAAPAANE